MLQRYVEVVRRWTWLLVFVTALAGGVAYYFGQQQPQTYQATTLLIVGPGIENSNPSLDDLRAAGMLMKIYAEMSTTKPVLDAVIGQLQLPMSPDELRRMIDIRTDDTTQILTIGVTGENAEQIKAIANTLAAVLIDISPTGVDRINNQVAQQAENQIRYIEENIAALEQMIQQFETSLANATSVEEQQIFTDQIALRRSQLAEMSRSLLNFYESSQQSRINQIKVIELATAAEPIDRGLRLTILMAALAGLILALTGILAYEYFDDTVRTESQISQRMGLPLLGGISRHKKLHADQLVVYAMPESQAVEDYRLLASRILLANRRPLPADATRTDVDAIYTGPTRFPRTLMISGIQESGDAGEVAANLAVTLAQTGHRVILIDANYHRPVANRLFLTTDRVSLHGILSGRTAESELTPTNALPTLSVLPGGPAPHNAFEMLASARMTNLIQSLKARADIILIAASRLPLFADSLVLASRVDGAIVVARSRSTRQDSLREVAELMESHGASLAGVILDHNHAGTSRSRGVRGRATQTPQELQTLVRDGKVTLNATEA